MVNFIIFLLAVICGSLVSYIIIKLLERGLSKEKSTKEKPKEVECKDIYSGVFHVFKKNGVKRERPVYIKKYKGNDVFYEYEENTLKEIRLSSNKENILKTLKGEKTKTFVKRDVV